MIRKGNSEHGKKYSEQSSYRKKGSKKHNKIKSKSKVNMNENNVNIGSEEYQSPRVVN